MHGNRHIRKKKTEKYKNRREGKQRQTENTKEPMTMCVTNVIKEEN